MEEKINYFTFPEGYEKAKELLDPMPPEARDGFMGGFTALMLAF